MFAGGQHSMAEGVVGASVRWYARLMQREAAQRTYLLPIT